MKFFIILTLTVMFALGSFCGNGSCADKPTDKPRLIDVRTDSEWNEGHLEGAILIPYDKIGEAIAKIVPDKASRIQLYCRSGRRSGIALDTLIKLGYENASNEGGIKDASEKLQIPVIK